MSETERRLDDIEKRLARLERAAEKPAMDISGLPVWYEGAPAGMYRSNAQFCACGRDICRAPDCPSHKPDPLGR